MPGTNNSCSSASSHNATENDLHETWLARHIGKLLFLLMGLALGAIAAVTFAYRDQFGALGVSDQQEVWAWFGDFVGGTLSAVLGLFGFFALLLTLRVQSTELSVSSRELRNSANALNEQNRAIAVQNFDSTFFQLLRLHNDIVTGMDLRDSEKKVISHGRDCFKEFYRQFRARCNPVFRGDELDSYSAVRVEYQRFFEDHEGDLGHYFRNLYRIYKFLDESPLIDDRHAYSGIVRAQLSSYELVFLFYNGISKQGDKFKPLMERYVVLENMPRERLLIGGEETELYQSSAFATKSSSGVTSPTATPASGFQLPASGVDVPRP